MLPHFSTLVAKKRKNFDLICFKTSEYSVKAADDESKVTLYKYWIVDRGFTKNSRKLKPRI